MRYSTQKKIRRYLALALAVVVASAACVYFGIPYYLLYDGDGEFEDRGVLAHERRFELDLGSVDITHAGKYTYRLRHMPRAHFVAGLELAEALPAIPPNASPDAGRVTLVVEGPAGTLVDERSALGDWTDSNGLRSVDPNAVPAVDATPEATPAAHAHGTAFTTEHFESYSITFEVVVPFPANIGAKLALQSD